MNARHGKMISVMTVMTVASVRLKILTYLVWVSWKGTKSNSIVWQSSKTSTNKYISMLIYVLQFLLNKYNHALKKSTLTNLYWPTCNGLKLCVRWCSFTKINVEILFLEISVPILKKNMMLRFERQLNVHEMPPGHQSVKCTCLWKRKTNVKLKVTINYISC